MNRKFATKLGVGAAVVVFILAITVVYALVRGYLVVAIKQPSQQLVVRTDTCGRDSKLIDDYNSAARSNGVDETMKKLVDTVKARSDYDKDPTCVFIVFRYVALANASEGNTEAKKLYDKLVSLSNQGFYPSLKLYDLGDVDDLEKILYWDQQVQRGD